MCNVDGYCECNGVDIDTVHAVYPPGDRGSGDSVRLAAAVHPPAGGEAQEASQAWQGPQHCIREGGEGEGGSGNARLGQSPIVTNSLQKLPTVTNSY